MSQSARGLFRATGKTARSVMVDLLDGAAVYVDAVAREENDFYPTPPEPTRAIIKAESDYLRPFRAIWEPACGDGSMMREIASAGHEVLGSDMIDRGCGAEIKSFYDYTKPRSAAVITNPPFNECNTGAWIRHGLDVLGLDYMALLLPLNWPGAETRSGLWARHTPARVYLMRWRIDFTGAGAPPMLNAWFVWHGKTADGDTKFKMLSKSDAGLTGVLI